MNPSNESLKIGVVGVGSMGRHHVRIAGESPHAVLVGFFDPDRERASQICELHSCRCFDSLDELLEQVDAVCVCAPTSTHLTIGEKCLSQGKHVLMEKPLADTVQGAEQLVRLAQDYGCILMVGHVERYNPAIDKLFHMLRREKESVISIDARRLSPFDGSRCIDVDVLHDLLIHDIDLALEVVGSPIATVSATGRKVFSNKIDVVYARIEFESGAVAVFWVGKCSPLKMRIFTVSTPTRLLVADTLTNSLTIHSAHEVPDQDLGVCLMGNLTVETVPVPAEEPLRRELEAFFHAVRTKEPPITDGIRGIRSLQAVELVARAITT